MASGGIVFAPGEAGTVQEIFQNATQNYYSVEGERPTPMVFFGKAFWNPQQADPPVIGGLYPKPRLSLDKPTSPSRPSIF